MHGLHSTDFDETQIHLTMFLLTAPVSNFINNQV